MSTIPPLFLDLLFVNRIHLDQQNIRVEMALRSETASSRAPDASPAPSRALAAAFLISFALHADLPQIVNLSY